MANTKQTQSSEAQSNLNDLFGLDGLNKLLERFNLPDVDIQAITESQRKDMEALADANREAYDGIKALAERRNEMIRDALERYQEALKDPSGEQLARQQAETVRQTVETATSNFRELAEMQAESRRKAWQIIQDRFQENLNSLQKLADPNK